MAYIFWSFPYIFLNSSLTLNILDYNIGINSYLGNFNDKGNSLFVDKLWKLYGFIGEVDGAIWRVDVLGHSSSEKSLFVTSLIGVDRS